MKITTINSRAMGTTIGGVPSPDRTFLLDGTVDDLPDQGSEGDRAYGLGGAAKGQVFEYSEAAQDWQKIEDAPTELPDASEADPGDVLTVTEEGTWAAAAPQGSGGWPVYTLVYDSDTDTYSLPEGVTQESLMDLVDAGSLPVLIYASGQRNTRASEPIIRLAMYFSEYQEENDGLVITFRPFEGIDIELPTYVHVGADNSVTLGHNTM